MVKLWSGIPSAICCGECLLQPAALDMLPIIAPCGIFIDKCWRLGFPLQSTSLKRARGYNVGIVGYGPFGSALHVTLDCG